MNSAFANTDTGGNFSANIVQAQLFSAYEIYGFACRSITRQGLHEAFHDIVDVHGAKSILSGSGNRTDKRRCTHHVYHLLDERAALAHDQGRPKDSEWNSGIPHFFFSGELRGVVPARPSRSGV
jgi:hypothetical protein